MEKRLQKLRKIMADRQLEALFVTNEHNRKYISGFTGTSGYVLVTESRAVLFTDFRYLTQAPQQAVLFEVIEHKPQIAETLKETLASMGVKRLGFEQDDVSYGTFDQYKKSLPGVELVPTSQVIESLRIVKDEREIRIIQEAADLADRTFAHVLDMLKPGVTERDVAMEIEFFMRRGGAASSSFDTIVASGERSALPHGVASNRAIGQNEFVTLDFGAYYNGYCSDLTRTVFIGNPSLRHQEIYDIVLEAQMAALNGIKAGMTGKEADAITRDIISDRGYGEFFGHGTGHGLGMEIHESPRLSKQSDHTLAPGMIVTVEPGIYIPGFGGVRIEDDIVVTESGAEVLTHSPKHFIVIN